MWEPTLSDPQHPQNHKPPFLRLYSKTYLETLTLSKICFRLQSHKGSVGTQTQISARDQNICSSYIEPRALNSIDLARSDDWRPVLGRTLETLSQSWMSLKDIKGGRRAAWPAVGLPPIPIPISSHFWTCLNAWTPVQDPRSWNLPQDHSGGSLWKTWEWSDPGFCQIVNIHSFICGSIKILLSIQTTTNISPSPKGSGVACG